MSPHVQVEQAIDLAIAVDRDHMRVVSPAAACDSRRNRCWNVASLGEMVWQHLERDDPVGFGVVGPVDLAHTAPADQLFCS